MKVNRFTFVTSSRIILLLIAGGGDPGAGRGILCRHAEDLAELRKVAADMQLRLGFVGLYSFLDIDANEGENGRDHLKMGEELLLASASRARLAAAAATTPALPSLAIFSDT